jgi:UBX domain-containing protein 1
MYFQSIKMSQCPQELDPADRKTSVHVNVIKRYADYCPLGIATRPTGRIELMGMSKMIGSSEQIAQVKCHFYTPVQLETVCLQ